MRCPVDGETLVMSERNGVEIDYCPHCRGVWLDRGELDKIIERSAAPGDSRSRREMPSDRDWREKRQEPRYRKRKKRESFLAELFDFD